MKKSIKIPTEFIRQTDDGRTVVTYFKDQKLFTVFIPLADVIDWSRIEYREINFDPEQEYRVQIRELSPTIQPMVGSVEGNVVEKDLQKLVEFGEQKGIN